MSDDKRQLTRRQFLQRGGYAVTFIPFIGVAARAADMPRLDESDPAAVALAYKHEVNDVDKEKYPRAAPADGRQPMCSNCVLFQAKADEEWAGCGIFPNKLVNARGWCSAYQPKA